MLELRGEARKFLKLELGDGRDIYLLFDWWHLNGVPYEKYGYQVVYDAHSKMEARLSTVIREEKWNWRPARSEELVKLRSRLSLVEIGEKDVPKWVIAKSGKYQVQRHGRL